MHSFFKGSLDAVVFIKDLVSFDYPDLLVTFSVVPYYYFETLQTQNIVKYVRSVSILEDFSPRKKLEFMALI